MMNDPLIDWKRDSQSFDSVGEMYDTFRPTYPAPLIEDILSITGLPQKGRILEIGSGTGKATMLFAQRGYSMLCIEPGEHLIRIARRNLSTFPQVSFRLTTFEDWESNENHFDLVISAQAFHWISPEIRYRKTAHALKPKGYLALFWNRPLPLEDSMQQKLNPAYQRYAPELASAKPSHEEGFQHWIRDLGESAYFDPPEVKQYRWKASYTTQQYLGLLNTYSDHLRLSEEKRQDLFSGLGDVLEGEGGKIEKPYEAVAFIALKRNPQNNTN